MSGIKAGASGLRLLTAAEILAAPDLAREEVSTPEWGEGTGVLVQNMSLAQRTAYFAAVRVRDGVQDDQPYNAALAVCSIVDENGNAIFSLDQINALAEKNSAPLARIATVALRLSFPGVEVLGENLKASTNGDSPSDSPSPSA